jgi:beta-galactosidase
MLQQNLCFDWRFHYYGNARPRFFNPTVSEWREVNLPHDWSIEGTRKPDNISSYSGGYFPMGGALYQKTLNLKDEWRQEKIFVEFEGVYMNAEVWLNRHYLGRHPYGYTSFSFDLTPYLDWEGANELKVFVDNNHQVNSRWYSGSGIYRPVWLMVADPVHVAQWGVYVTTPEISKDSAAIKIRTRVENESDQDQNVTLQSRIIDPQGNEVGSAAGSALVGAQNSLEFENEAWIENPQLWSPDTPRLYQVETSVVVDDKTTDSELITFGIRSLEFSAEKGFLLNGEPTLLKGGCVHHDNGILGAASYPRSEERKVRAHKDSGYNAIRCAHNPPAPAFLEACDRLGMMVIDEAFDCWRDGKNNGDYHVAFDDWWQKDLDAMLNRDRNHPCIIAWSIGNEVMERDGYGGGYQISSMLAERVRQVDPTRPVTAAICGSWRGDPWEIMDPAFATLDLGGYNYQWGQYRSDHERFPPRIMMGTESFPLEAFENWNEVTENPYVIGDFVWTSLDYLGEAGIGRVLFEGEKSSFLGEYPWHQANCGDLDLCGFKRPQSYYRDTLWFDDPRLTIVVHPVYPEGKIPEPTRWGWPDVWPNWNWPGSEGKTFNVEIYANCEEVELFLDGRSLGRVPCAQEQKFRAMFEVVYQPGTLKAVGYRAGQPVTEKVLSTTGEPAQIRLTADRKEISADGLDLSFITVEVLDSQGRLHPAAKNDIFFTIRGAGSILSVGSSNPVSEEAYVGNQRKVHRGRALLVVRAEQEPGEIKLSAQADGLEGAEIVIQSNP